MSNNGEFEAKIRNRVIKFPAVDGLSPLEMGTLVRQVGEKMDEIERELGIVDSSKISILAAYSFAVELYNLRQKSETNLEADSKRLDEMMARLEKTLAESDK
jgi:cell division protein ZapA (FtsZ GTPase activity inhibitor)